MAKKKLVPVKFLQKYRVYTVGEVAGFPAEWAKSLCEGKDPVAERVSSNKVETKES